MPNVLPVTLRRELEWAVGYLCQHGQPSAEQIDTIRRSIRAASPMLAKRFQMFLNAAHPYEADDEAQQRLGYLLVALERRAAGQSWRLLVPEDELNAKASALLQVRCTPAFKRRLELYAERGGVDVSTVVRRAVEAYADELREPTYETEEGD